MASLYKGHERDGHSMFVDKRRTDDVEDEINDDDFTEEEKTEAVNYIKNLRKTRGENGQKNRAFTAKPNRLYRFSVVDGGDTSVGALPYIDVMNKRIHLDVTSLTTICDLYNLPEGSVVRESFESFEFCSRWVAEVPLNFNGQNFIFGNSPTMERFIIKVAIVPAQPFILGWADICYLRLHINYGSVKVADSWGWRLELDCGSKMVVQTCPPDLLDFPKPNWEFSSFPSVDDEFYHSDNEIFYSDDETFVSNKEDGCCQESTGALQHVMEAKNQGEWTDWPFGVFPEVEESVQRHCFGPISRFPHEDVFLVGEKMYNLCDFGDLSRFPHSDVFEGPEWLPLQEESTDLVLKEATPSQRDNCNCICCRQRDL